MSFARFAVTPDPLLVDRVAAELEREAQRIGEGCGALNAFVGVVRATHKQRRVRYLEYEAFVPLALKTFARIEAEIQEEWPHARIAIHHRLGRLEVGDASVVIVSASAHRVESFQVCRYAIERVKQIAPVWKHEFFDDGDAWVEGAAADAEDDVARRRAKETACA